MEKKPYKGRIKDWDVLDLTDSAGLGGFMIVGTFIDHPNHAGTWGHTSEVIRYDKGTGEIETINSRYTLIIGEKHEESSHQSC